ncbi:MAG: Fe-S cluster assembly protein SufD [Tatlockia sp.]|jgi:Fe-S cluster assembly protein SufD
MSEVVEFYHKQAKDGFSTIPWFATLQAKGLHELERVGFPTRRHEEWKYTLVDALLRERFMVQENSQAEPFAQSDFPYTPQASVLNGQVSVNQDGLPEGVVVQSLEQALTFQEEKIKPYIGQLLQHTHGFQALNTAMLRCGVFIHIPAGVVVETPIVVSHAQNQDNQAVHSRLVIVVEEGAAATVIEDYWGNAECSYLTNTVTELFAAKEAKLTHYKMQREGKKGFHIGHLAARLGHASQVQSHVISLGAQLARSDLEISLEGEGASCLLNGIYVPTEGKHMDHHTTVNHRVPNCQSEQDYKGILLGQSRAVFNGKVIVAKDAQHTEAKQQNKNLLLSPKAEIDTKPQLEIFADDVICTHGATVGQLDEEALFYLATRGIEQQDARRFLIHAFAENNLRLINDTVLASWMTDLLSAQLR